MVVYFNIIGNYERLWRTSNGCVSQFHWHNYDCIMDYVCMYIRIEIVELNTRLKTGLWQGYHRQYKRYYTRRKKTKMTANPFPTSSAIDSSTILNKLKKKQVKQKVKAT